MTVLRISKSSCVAYELSGSLAHIFMRYPPPVCAETYTKRALLRAPGTVIALVNFDNPLSKYGLASVARAFG